MGCKAAVTHEDDLAVGKPANDLEHTLFGPVGEFLVPQTAGFSIAFGWGKKCQKWQCLDARPPWQSNGIRLGPIKKLLVKYAG